MSSHHGGEKNAPPVELADRTGAQQGGVTPGAIVAQDDVFMFDRDTGFSLFFFAYR